MDKNGFEDIKLNVWAVSAGGELAGVQLVSLAGSQLPSAWVRSWIPPGQPWIQKWLADAGPLRTAGLQRGLRADLSRLKFVRRVRAADCATSQSNRVVPW